MTTAPTLVVLDDWEHALADRVNWQAIKAVADVHVYSQPLRGAALIDALKNAQMVVLFRDRTPFDSDIIRQLPHLRFIVFTGGRNRTLDMAAAEQAGIEVIGTEWGPSKACTTELTWTLILAANRRLTEINLSKDRASWRDPVKPLHAPGVLSGKYLGLIGLGQIGQRVSAVAKAFGMRVLTWSPNMTPERAREHGALSVDLNELLARSDIVSLHLVASQATYHLLNVERLALMKPTAVLVNTSRAELIDTNALISGLQSGNPAYCALDVFDHEPLPADHALLSLDNVLLTPHCGFIGDEVLQTFADAVEKHALRFFR